MHNAIREMIYMHIIIGKYTRNTIYCCFFYYYLITFDLWKIEPGGAVGGRFILILDANGTRDARRNTDGKSNIGSSAKLSSS